MAILGKVATIGAFYLVAGCADDQPKLREPVAVPVTAIPYDCKATREYVTSLQYLRSAKELAIEEVQARILAAHIAKGCTGAAKRFVEVTHLLLKSGLDGRAAVEIAKDFAATDDETAETFQFVFKRAFLREYLDINLTEALRFARSLSLELKERREQVRRDFAALVNFCVRHSGLDLPKPGCAEMTSRLLRYDHGLAEDDGVAEPFIAAFEFLTKDSGPNLTTQDAIKIAEELVAISPEAVKNFTDAFSFAMDRAGLAMDRKSAMRFARDLAKATVGQSASSVAPAKKPG